MLPKVSQQEYITILPSSKKKIKFRHYLAKEHKILLTALENNRNVSEKNKDISAEEMKNAVKQIVQNCIITDNIFVDDMTDFDLEHMFIQLKIKSSGNIINYTTVHEPCGTEIKLEIDLENVDLVNPEVQDKIMLNDTIGVKLKYPSIKNLEDATQYKQSATNMIFFLISRSIDKIFTDEEVIDASTVPNNELLKWVEDSLSNSDIQRVIEFIEKKPYNSITVSYTCPKCKTTESIEVKDLSNFFI